MEIITMKTVRANEITFIAQEQRKGSSRIVYNVNVNGRPFGQVWTFKVPGETHPWHVGELNGFHDIRGSKEQAFELIKDRVATYY